MLGRPSQTDFPSGLIAKVAAGDSRAFNEFVREHRAAVFRLAVLLTRDDALAEDVMQQTFISAYENAGSYRGDASERTWLMTICRNTSYRASRKRGEVASLHDQSEEPLMELGLLAGWGTESPEQALHSAETRDELMKALDELPPDLREVIVLRDLQELSGEEVATILGVGLAAMKSRLHRARLKLAALVRRGASQ